MLLELTDILFKLEQPENEVLAYVALSGSLICVRLVQLLNASLPIDVSAVPRETEERYAQFWNAPVPIVLREDPAVNEVRALPEKA